MCPILSGVILCELLASRFLQPNTLQTRRRICPVSVAECEAKVRLSSVECKPAVGTLARYKFTQSCLYHNVYFIDGVPTLFFTPGQEPLASSIETMRNRDDFTDHFRPVVETTSSIQAMCAVHCVRFHDDVSVLGDYFLGNIAHALLDSMYSVFVSLIEYSGRHLDPFRLISIQTNRDALFIRNVVDQSAPLGLVFADEFFLDPPEFDVHQMRELLVPNFARCMSCTNDGEPIHYGMGMGYELDALRRLREHLFVQFNLPRSPGYEQKKMLRGIAVDNKRFTDNDRNILLTAFTGAGPRIEGRIVNWAGMPFRSQLHLLSDTQIHLSGVGTSCTNQPFLPDGAVHINLGSCTRAPYQESVVSLLFYSSAFRDPVPGYMDQPIVGSTPYHRALYYPIDEICNGLTVRRLGLLLDEAVRLYDSHFSIPVPRGINLAPSGLVVQELMRRDVEFREYISDPVAHKDCSTGRYFWPEIVLNPNGPWSAGGVCKLNGTLLLELKEQFGIMNKNLLE